MDTTTVAPPAPPAFPGQTVDTFLEEPIVPALAGAPGPVEPESVEAPVEKKPSTREYVVLAANDIIDEDDQKRIVYGVVGVTTAGTDKAAINAVVPADVPGTFLAIPKRSWKPHMGLSNASTVTKPDGTQETVVTRVWG